MLGKFALREPERRKSVVVMLQYPQQRRPSLPKDELVKMLAQAVRNTATLQTKEKPNVKRAKRFY